MFSLQLLGDNDKTSACNSVRLIQAGSRGRGHVKIRGDLFGGLIQPLCDAPVTTKCLVSPGLCFHTDLYSAENRNDAVSPKAVFLY